MRIDNKLILVVDDETKIVEVLRSYLVNSRYTVCAAYSGNEALEMFERVQPSLVVLDLMLPDICGEEVCRTIRKKSTVPIIMLTAKVEEEDILKGFDIGADDYILKPFSPRQLVARVGALLRRAAGDKKPPCGILLFNEGDLIIDTVKHEIKRSGEIINLTPVEFKILATMAKYPAKVFTREELIIFVFDGKFERFSRTIDTHVKNLRQKLEKDNKNPRFILTVHGIGYRFGGS